MVPVGILWLAFNGAADLSVISLEPLYESMMRAFLFHSKPVTLCSPKEKKPLHFHPHVSSLKNAAISWWSFLLLSSSKAHLGKGTWQFNNRHQSSQSITDHRSNFSSVFICEAGSSYWVVLLFYLTSPTKHWHLLWADFGGAEPLPDQWAPTAVPWPPSRAETSWASSSSSAFLWVPHGC